MAKLFYILIFKKMLFLFVLLFGVVLFFYVLIQKEKQKKIKARKNLVKRCFAFERKTK